MFSHIDDEGHHFQLLSEISDHNSYGNTILVSDGLFKSINGNNLPKKNTDGWKIQVGWKGISTSWVPLKDLKGSNPLELAECASNNYIELEPSFRWWLRDVEKKWYLIIGKVAKKYCRNSQNLGIFVPKTVYEAIYIYTRKQ